MTEPRLASTVLASGLMRFAEQAGGFATVLARGDPVSGALLLQLLEKGQLFSLFERIPDRTGVYQWTQIGPQASENKESFEAYLDRRRSRDPDLWVVELDIPDAERFVADILSNA